LRHRNFVHALVTLSGALVVMAATLALPVSTLAALQGYRPLQSAPLALWLTLPQLALIPALAAFCSQPWVDCRWVMAGGLGLCAVALLCASDVTGAWTRDNYYWLLALQVFAQPMIVVALLLSATSVVAPMEGPHASAWFNTVKGFAAVAGSSLLGHLLAGRLQLHLTRLLEHAGPLRETSAPALGLLWRQVNEQALVLAAADVYRLLALLAVLLMGLIPLLPHRVRPPGAAADGAIAATTAAAVASTAAVTITGGSPS
jgi:DHA2 family multidrug resistance protein